MARVGVIGWPHETNVELGAAWRDRGIPAEFVTPWAAAGVLQPDDVAVGRLDVLRTHDKLHTAICYGAAEFDEGYDLPGGDVYLDAAEALGLVAERVPA